MTTNSETVSERGFSITIPESDPLRDGVDVELRLEGLDGKRLVGATISDSNQVVHASLEKAARRMLQRRDREVVS